MKTRKLCCGKDCSPRDLIRFCMEDEICCTILQQDQEVGVSDRDVFISSFYLTFCTSPFIGYYIKLSVWPLEGQIN